MAEGGRRGRGGKREGGVAGEGRGREAWQGREEGGRCGRGGKREGGVAGEGRGREVWQEREEGVKCMGRGVCTCEGGGREEGGREEGGNVTRSKCRWQLLHVILTWSRSEATTCTTVVPVPAVSDTLPTYMLSSNMGRLSFTSTTVMLTVVVASLVWS